MQYSNLRPDNLKHFVCGFSELFSSNHAILLCFHQIFVVVVIKFLKKFSLK